MRVILFCSLPICEGGRKQNSPGASRRAFNFLTDFLSNFQNFSKFQRKLKVTSMPAELSEDSKYS